MKVLVIVGHPRGTGSLSGELAASYMKGAIAAGCEVETIDLSSLRFERDVVNPSPREQEFEPDLEDARAAIERTDHLVLVYPTWWGTYPGLMKSFLDRILLPGWAFSEITGGTGFEGHLTGRTAELITTMDTPGPVYRLLYHAPGRNALAAATLGFCGIKVTRHTRFGPVNTSSEPQRKDWIAKTEKLGKRLKSGPRTAFQDAWLKISPWLAGLRLQFYPMTFIAYWLGAVLAERAGYGFDLARFWMGYGFLFAVEAATVFCNDLMDAETDRNNAYWGPFNGGSRVLQSGLLSAASLERGIFTALVAAFVLAIILVAGANAPFVLGLFLLVCAFLALEYTAPPLTLSYRTLGEIDVGLTHSVLAILAGLLVQGGSVRSWEPWLFGVPLFLSILPAIILSGIPDHEADRAVGKRTIAVASGIRQSFAISAVLAGLAAAAMIGMDLATGFSAYGAVVSILVVAHAAWIVRLCLRERTEPAVPRRIDRSMVVALSFILWFCIVPLWRLAG